MLTRSLSSLQTSCLIVLLVFAGTLVVRHAGLIQFLEFQGYDYLVRIQPKSQRPSPIVLVEMTETDIQNPALDYPIYDRKLAELLVALQAEGPAVIGLDIWRDIPVPKNGADQHVLNEILKSSTNVVAIFTLGGIAPPPVLKDLPDRLAFNDNFPPDVGVDRTIPKVRRSLLIADHPSKQSYDSLAFRLALLYLERHGIEPQPDPVDPRAFRLGKARLAPFRSNDGAYVGADAAGWQMLLDFKCPTNFVRFTISQALAGEIPPGTLRDQIVLIGINTPSVADERVTPVRRDHRGVELQALTIDQLLRHALKGEQPLRYWSDTGEDGWMLLWCIAGGAIGYGVRSPWRFAFLSLGCLLAQAGLAAFAFGHGWWIPIVAPSTAFVPAAGLVTSYVSFQERREREQLMHLFSKQVSPDIAQALWERRDEFLDGKRPRSQKVTATILFTDLEGFSTTSEKMEPAQLMDWLNEYMEAMAAPIMAHQGVIEKYIGDAIMAVFGVPLARSFQEEISQDARRAVQCALVMRDKMAELNARWQQRGLPACKMRVGIHTGSLVAGSLGSSERQEYTVIGDSVNTASRLESFDKNWVDPDDHESACRILMSEATYNLVAKEFLTTRVGTMNLKNKNEPVTIFSVTGRRTI